MHEPEWERLLQYDPQDRGMCPHCEGWFEVDEHDDLACQLDKEQGERERETASELRAMFVQGHLDPYDHALLSRLSRLLISSGHRTTWVTNTIARLCAEEAHWKTHGSSTN